MNKNTKKIVDLDYIIKLKKGSIVVLSGIKGHGKKSFIDVCCDDLNRKYGSRTLFFSTKEEYTQHFKNLVSFRSEKFCPKETLLVKDPYNCLDGVVEALKSVNLVLKNETNEFDKLLKNVETINSENKIDILVLDSFKISDFENKSNIDDNKRTDLYLTKLQHLALKLDIVVIISVDITEVTTVPYNNALNSLFTKVKKHKIPSTSDIPNGILFNKRADANIVIYNDIETDEILIDIEKDRFNKEGRVGFIRLKNFKNKNTLEVNNENWYVKVDNLPGIFKSVE